MIIMPIYHNIYYYVLFLACSSSLIYRGVVIAVIALEAQSNLITAITVLLLHIPNFIIAIITTVAMDNIKILYQHPSLVLLPCFTFFSFQKIGICDDARIKFSPLMTIFNIIISSICYGSIFGFMNSMVDEDWDKTYFLTICIPIFAFGCLMTLIVMFMETCCCCCGTLTCCNIKDDVRIYDPSDVTGVTDL